MRIIPRIRASALYWVFVAALGGWLMFLSSEAHAPQKALELLPVMHVVRVEEAQASARSEVQLPNELPKTSVVQAVPPAHKSAALKPKTDPHALEAQVRDELAHEGFPKIGVSAGRDGAVYIAGTMFDNSEPDQIDGLVRKVPGVTEVHFTEIHMMKPTGHAYIGTQTGKAAGGGVRVLRVFHGSPAEAAGIRKGDIIVSFGDHRVKDADEFREMVWSHEGGTRVPVIIARGHDREVVEVRLGQAAQMAAK